MIATKVLFQTNGKRKVMGGLANPGSYGIQPLQWSWWW